MYQAHVPAWPRVPTHSRNPRVNNLLEQNHPPTKTSQTVSLQVLATNPFLCVDVYCCCIHDPLTANWFQMITSFIELLCQTPSGASPCSLRFWRSAQAKLGSVPLILWELRRLGDACDMIGNRYVHKWVADQKGGTWSKLFALSGCILTIVASKKSMKATSSSVGMAHEYAQDEWTIETSAMIALLLFWMNSGSLTAGLMVQTLMRQTLGPAAIDELIGAMVNDESWKQCVLEPKNGICDHVFPYVQKLQAPGLTLEEKYPAVVSMCGALVYYVAVCGASAQAWPPILKLLSRLICEGLLTAGHCDALRDGPNDPSQAKRRKISASALAACSERAAAHHVSMGTVACMEGVASRATCSRYHEHAVLPHLARAWAKAPHMYVIGVSLDCKRLGNPAEELCCYYMVDSQSSEATWLPFQVCSCSCSVSVECQQLLAQRDQKKKNLWG